MIYWLLLATLLCVGLAVMSYLFVRTVVPIARLRLRWTYYSDHFRIASEIHIFTPLGLHFGEGPLPVLDRERNSRPLLKAAMHVMKKLPSLPRR